MKNIILILIIFISPKSFLNSSLPDSTQVICKTNQDSIINYNKQVIETPLKNNYLYTFPPYPIPAYSQVNFMLYWDTKKDIKSADIAIYNINGNKISCKEEITINKHSNYNGVLTWNTTEKLHGIYFINIKHGTAYVTVKVLIK